MKLSNNEIHLKSIIKWKVKVKISGKEEVEKMANMQYLFFRGLIVFLIGVFQKARAFVLQKTAELTKEVITDNELTSSKMLFHMVQTNILHPNGN